MIFENARDIVFYGEGISLAEVCGTSLCSVNSCLQSVVHLDRAYTVKSEDIASVFDGVISKIILFPSVVRRRVGKYLLLEMELNVRIVVAAVELNGIEYAEVALQRTGMCNRYVKICSCV